MAYKKALIASMIFGVILTWAGFFIGLQISVPVGDLLVFAFSLYATFQGVGFATLDWPILAALFVFNSASWGLITYLTYRFIMHTSD